MLCEIAQNFVWRWKNKIIIQSQFFYYKFYMRHSIKYKEPYEEGNF
jgi:hypothetical protein